MAGSSPPTRGNPTREEVAESFLPWLALRHWRGRVSPELAETFGETIPNRIACFDSQPFELYPLTVDEIFRLDLPLAER